MNQDRPALCQGCQDYCGLGRPGDRIVCGIHPYGWSDGGSCPDWRGKGTAPEEESITDEVARQVGYSIFSTIQEQAFAAPENAVEPSFLTQEQREVMLFVGNGVLTDLTTVMRDRLSRRIEEAIFGMVQELTEGGSIARAAEPLCPQSVCPVCYHELSEYCSLNCQEPVEPSAYRDFV